MLRIHFTSADIMRVRLAPGPDPLLEATLSAHQVNLVGGAAVFGEWRSRVAPRLSVEARAFLRRTPPRGYTPDVLMPADRTAEALQAYHDQAIAPYWAMLRREVDADIRVRARALTGGGTAALLASVHPSITWQEPVLSIETKADRDLYLDGRGLILQPAFFCWRAPIWLTDPDLAPVLVYPIPHRMSWLRPPGTDRHERALAALLGRTRAAVLSVLTDGVSTSELARHIGVSAPSASEHASVLRDAGLVASRRERNSMLHTLTPLGRAVLHGGVVLPDVSPMAAPPGRERAPQPG